MVTFEHENPTVGILKLRLPPTNIEWTYNLNTQTTPTYGGEVIQLLSINFDKLILSGRFGKEGPHGSNVVSNTLSPRPVAEFRNYSGGGIYSVGLTQMTEYFQRYFAIASQGRDAVAQGNYNQEPMKVTYSGALNVEIDDGVPEGPWLAYPTSFPSFRRSNEDFAPEWRVEFEIYEAPLSIQNTSMDDELSRLREAVGYIPFNRFSDPLGASLPVGFNNLNLQERASALRAATIQVHGQVESIIDHYQDILPAYNDDDIDALLLGSGPTFISPGSPSLLPPDSVPGGHGGV